MNRLMLGLALTGLVTTTPAAARAQGARPEFNIGVGPTIPSGQFSDRNPVGFNVAGGIGLTPRGSPLGLRLEGLYNLFNGRADYTIVCGGATTCSRDAYATGLTLNLKYEGLLPYNGRPGELRRGGTSSLYVIGGFGFYNIHAPLNNVITPGGSSGYENRTQAYTGWNLGGGIRIPAGGVSFYLEARMHVMSQTATRFVPIAVGIIF